MATNGTLLESISAYYGTILKDSTDLKTTACCTTEAIPAHHKSILAAIDDDILTRFYGCGSPIPEALGGKTILDLGCGTGRDVYLAAALAGENGTVIGVDMTSEQLEVANRHADAQMKKFGFGRTNVQFKSGYIEDLKSLGIEDNSVDVVISNCVINLSPDKKAVFREIFRVLKPGGELFFSDVFSDRRVPGHFMHDPKLHGECLAGAMYTEDFRRLLAELGCPDYRVVNGHSIEINNPDIEKKIGMIHFQSLTIRAFKLETLEDICEDYGQVATYLGSIPESQHRFVLDDHHIFETGKPMLVCGNTASMIQETRYGEHFIVHGDRSVHYGAFECDPGTESVSDLQGGCC
jgi:arsenite methyltransferase